MNEKQRHDGAKVLEGGVHVTVPTVHLNGTGGETLFQGFFDAWTAIHHAADKLSHAAPHGRDYYTQGDSAYDAARGEHEQRLKRLQDIKNELKAIMAGIRSQIDERKR